ncbi:MAG: GGDEF domain-containing protein [Hyphomicrobiales bacterium]|nr:GGDEF domain-containing protein [Hyphomicrobiales bacterium]
MRTDIRSKQDIARQVVCVTIVSVLASIVVTTFVMRLQGVDFLEQAMIPAIVVPLLVAPAVTYRMSVLQYRLYLQKLVVERMAAEDPLTGLANRRAFFKAAERQLLLARRHQHGVAFVLVDIDRFKRINDQYGHAAGDKVIVGVAEAIRSEVRETDIVARVGGEEFAAFLFDADAKDAMRIAESIRRRIVRLDFGELGITDKVTASFGVALNPFAKTVDELMAAADAKLYEAKHDGRNVVRMGIAEAMPEREAHVA